MVIVRYRFHPANPPRMVAEQRARLEAPTDEEITAAAQSDPDNPPLTDQEIARRARDCTSLTQAAFAEAFAVNPWGLRNTEPGRKQLIACLCPSTPWGRTIQNEHAGWWGRRFGGAVAGLDGSREGNECA